MWCSGPTARTCKKTRAQRGLSLIELMVVITLLGAFFGMVYESVIVGLRSVRSAGSQEDVRLQLARTLDFLTREVSVAGNVDNAEDQRLQFDADVDGNGTTENDINYQVVSGDLQRTYNGTTVTLIGDLQTLDFNYTDATGANLSTPVGSQPTRDTIRVVHMTVTAAGANGATLSVMTAAYLRNNS